MKLRRIKRLTCVRCFIVLEFTWVLCFNVLILSINPLDNGRQIKWLTWVICFMVLRLWHIQNQQQIKYNNNNNNNKLQCLDWFLFLLMNVGGLLLYFFGVHIHMDGSNVNIAHCLLSGISRLIKLFPEIYLLGNFVRNMLYVIFWPSKYFQTIVCCFHIILIPWFSNDCVVYEVSRLYRVRLGLVSDICVYIYGIGLPV